MTYCDSSFLLALYLRADRFHEQALKIAARFEEPIPFTLLCELELQNGLHRCVAAGTLTWPERDTVFRQMEHDEVDNVFQRIMLDSAQHFARARELSRKFTPIIAARSLDILHVAAALLLKADRLASFDQKQRHLASATGLKLLPAKI